MPAIIAAPLADEWSTPKKSNACSIRKKVPRKLAMAKRRCVLRRRILLSGLFSFVMGSMDHVIGG